MGNLLRDITFGTRQLTRSPGFTTAAVLCLALGIGANSAAFSFVRSFLLQNAPIREPESLVRMYLNYSHGLRFGSWSYPDYLDMREATTDVFSEVLIDAIGVFNFSSSGENRRIFGTYASGNFFDMLGIRPQLGRAFLPEEDATDGTHPVAVLDHAFWQDVFGGDPGIVGRTILLNGQELTVIGVAPADFGGNNTAMSTALWVPFRMEPALNPTGSMLTRRGNHWIQSATARLRPGVSVAQAKDRLDAFYANLATVHPGTATGVTVDFFPESEAALHPAVRGGFAAMLSLFSAVVAFILLLACANVAGLLVARSTARRREVGIRLALGAGRWRLVRQLLTESTMLAVLGGGLGVLLGMLLIRLVSSFQPPTELPLRIDVRMDLAVLAMTSAISVATGFVFGLAPAITSTRQDLVTALRDGAPTTGAGAGRLRQALVVGQVALCMVLLIAAGMVLRSLQQVRQLDIGFNPDNLINASIDPALQGYSVAELPGFYASLRTELLALPGVQAVGFAASVPLALMSSQSSVLPEGYEVPAGQDWPSLDINIVGVGYFQAMGIPILAGRPFAAADDAEGRPVAMVNEAFAARFWPGADPIGKHITARGAERIVVGLVPTGRYFSIGEDPKPYYYLARAQAYRGEETYVHVRTASDPTGTMDSVRAAVGRLDPTLPVSDLNTMHGTLGLAYLPARMAAGIVSAFAALALLLAAVGLYGVVSFAVAQRVRDIGVQMALGARATDVVRGVMRQGVALVGFGLGIGLLGGFLLSRAAVNVLYGVSATDPLAYGMAFTVLLATALLASFVPARRATRVDPLVALRSD